MLGIIGIGVAQGMWVILGPICEEASYNGPDTVDNVIRRYVYETVSDHSPEV
jgi:hypothetical protein